MLRTLNSIFLFSKSPSKMVVNTVRNPNLKFHAGQYQINIYPFYPTVYQKKGNKQTFEISQDSHVLAFTFLSR